jgi:hypothetical protein
MYENRAVQNVCGPRREEVMLLLLVIAFLPNMMKVIKIKVGEMDGACGMYGGEEKYAQGLLVGES